jgi:hypothetical protein
MDGHQAGAPVSALAAIEDRRGLARRQQIKREGRGAPRSSPKKSGFKKSRVKGGLYADSDG